MPLTSYDVSALRKALNKVNVVSEIGRKCPSGTIKSQVATRRAAAAAATVQAVVASTVSHVVDSRNVASNVMACLTS